jgi:diguanylate cyclase (GGDEF)-like protein
MRLANLAYATTMIVLLATYCVAAGLRPAVVAAASVVGMGTIVFRVLRVRPERWVAWLTIALSVGLLGIGNMMLLREPGVAATTSPGPPDVLYLTAYLPLTVGLLWVGRPPRPSRQGPAILDTVALALAGCLVAWIAVVRHAVMEPQLTYFDRATAIAGWVGYVAVFAVSVRLVVEWPTDLARVLLGTGAIALLVSDLMYGAGFLRLERTPGALAGVGFLAVSLFFGAAALTTSMADPGIARHVRAVLGPGRLAILAVALLVGPTVLLVQATPGPVTADVSIAVISAAVGGVVLARLWLLARAYRRRIDRDRAVRVASRALISATTKDDAVAGVADALADAVPNSITDVRLIDAAGAATVGPPSVLDLAEGAEGAGILTFLPSGGGPSATLVCTAPMAQLVELDGMLLLLADQMFAALHRIELLARLQEEEKQRYFRSLVLTSTDVTLISRDDRVAYATPSAGPMFGRDVKGRRFGELVIRNPATTERMTEWADVEDGADGEVLRPDGRRVDVLVHRRDLTADPTVVGVVSTLRDVTSERDLQRDLAYRASHDALTGLANAQLFTEELRSQPTGPGDDADTGRAVLFLDLDDFKAVNDNHGHEVGNALLSIVAQRIEACLRSNDLAARLGGDEFAILLRRLPSADHARGLAERIVTTLSRPAVVRGVSLACHASIGVAYADRPEQWNTMLADADSALYAAKAHGKGWWWQHHDDDDRPTRPGTTISPVPNGIHDGDLPLLYQPVVELCSGRTVGFEAVVADAGVGRVRPPSAPLTHERAAPALGPDDRALRQAIVDAAALDSDPDAETSFMTVNVSARQLRHPEFARSVRQHLAASGLRSSLLTLEVREYLLSGGNDPAWSVLADLHADGIRVAIDQFGSGYASLKHLGRPALDVIKVDSSFVDDTRCTATRTTLRALVGLCDKLGLVAMAEGVDDPYIEGVFADAGFRFGQGLLYAPPMPIGEAAAWRRAADRKP